MERVRALPHVDPGAPDLRSPGRFLLWVARGQRRTLAGGIAFGVVWMGGQAALPGVVGAAIDHGVLARDTDDLLAWSAAVLGAGLVTALAGIARHRFAVTNWLTAAYRLHQLLARHAVRLGHEAPRRTGTGEAVAVATADAQALGNTMDISARASGAVVAVVVVAAALLTTSVPLGLLVLLGVPVLLLVLAPLLRPLHRRQVEQRAQVGRLTMLGGDTVSGLRVLRGIGGEDAFVARYRARSDEARRSGVAVAHVQSLLEGVQVLLPGAFVALITWLGARMALAGEITVGDLVAFYGYAAFLVLPLRTITEAADKYTRGFVAAKRVVRVLSEEPTDVDPHDPAGEPPPGVPLSDELSELVVAPGRLTAVVSAAPEESAALADRLGRYADPTGVRLGDVLLARLPLDAVRRRVLVHDADPRLFTGRLREELDVRGDAGDEALLRALDVASAQDVLDVLDGGLDAMVEERGRSFSGGQRQRLVLARSLVADPEVLVLVEPTSAVDAHTEARIAAALGEARAGRTTVVVTASPLLLDRADTVVFVRAGRVVAQVPHRELLRDPEHGADYRAVVTRGEEE